VELGIFSAFPYFSTVGDPDSQLFQVPAWDREAILLWCEWNILNVTYRVQPHHNTSLQLLQYQRANPRDTFTLSGAIYDSGSCISTLVVISLSHEPSSCVIYIP
jgi:hypothetical protein